MLSEMARRTSQPESIADLLLDIDTFKLAPLNTQMSAVQSLTVQDIQRVAARLFKDASPATIVVGDAEQLKPAFVGSLEMRSEKPDPKTAVDPAVPAKKP
jgi:predicted Zn-dependent peptidase